MHHVGIVGSRQFTDVRLMTAVIDSLDTRFGSDWVLVSGGAKGADSIGERLFRVGHTSQPIIHYPDSRDAYRAFGADFRARAFGRNGYIVRDSDLIIAFFVTTEMSGGTLNTVNQARRAGVHVIAHMGDGRWVSYRPTGPSTGTYSNHEIGSCHAESGIACNDCLEYCS
jgi:hypothetical protein